MSQVLLQPQSQEPKAKTVTILSFGGGINSVAMLIRLWMEGRAPDWVVFSDTREEWDHTYRIMRYAQKWCTARGIKFAWVHSHLLDELESKARRGEYTPTLPDLPKLSNEEMMQRDGRPPRPWRAGMLDWFHSQDALILLGNKSCTGRFKKMAIRHWMRDIGIDTKQKPAVTQYLGIATEEASRRMKPSDVQYIQNEYPLVEWNMDRNACKDFLSEHAQDWPPIKHSGCKGCPAAGIRGLMDFAREEPEQFDRWLGMEEHMHEARGRTDLTLIRSGRLLREIKNAVETQSSLTSFDELEDEAPGCEGSACFT